MKIVFFGTPQFAVPTLELLFNHPQFDVVGVVTQPDKRRGRGNQLVPSPVKMFAQDHNLPIWQPARIKKDRETLDLLQQTEADIFVVVAYGQILSSEILEMPRLMCVNVHGSILPKYRGAAPIQWCIYHGETETGITTMQMDVGMDTGPMLLKSFLPIGLFDHAGTVMNSLADMGGDLLIETLLKLSAGEIQPIPQNNDEATYAPLIKDSDYQIDWQQSAIALHNQVRGFYPHCVTNFRETNCKILETVPLVESCFHLLPPEYQELFTDLNKDNNIPPGTVMKIAKKHGPIVQTGTGWLLLKQVHLAGKKVNSGWDFANGVRLQVGEIFI